MARIILAVIAGFFAWSLVWVGGERLLSVAWPDWFGVHQAAFEKATYDGTAFTPDQGILVLNMVRGIVVTVLAGFLTAVIAGENRRSTPVVGVLLFAFGLIIVWMTWHIVPVWYHVLFSLMLIPLTIIGGKLKRFA